MKKVTIHLLMSLIISSLVVAEQKEATDDVIVQATRKSIPADKTKHETWLWNSFAEQPNAKSSKHFSTKNWEPRFDQFAKKLTSKADRKSLDANALRNILAKIKTEKKRSIMIPVAAYSTNFNGDPAWIVVVHWASSDKPVYTDFNSDGIMEEGWPTMSHTCVFAYKTQKLELIAFISCM